jgi:hypothetical protein
MKSTKRGSICSAEAGTDRRNPGDAIPLADAPEMFVRPAENVPIGNSERGIHQLAADRVGGQTLELRRGAQHKYVGVLVRQVKPLACQYGRRPGRIPRARAGEPFFPNDFTGLAGFPRR